MRRMASSGDSGSRRKTHQTRRGYAMPSPIPAPIVSDEEGASDAESEPARSEGGRKKRKGRASVAPPPAATEAPQPGSPSALGTESPGPRPRAAVDIEVARVGGPTSPFDGAWRAFEIWTRNRVYGLDGMYRCIAVFDRATGKLESDHPFVGARLVGGQVRLGETSEVWQPLPIPGAEAVFEQSRGARTVLSHTSTVERVVLRLRGVSTAHDHLLRVWNGVVERES